MTRRPSGYAGVRVRALVSGDKDVVMVPQPRAAVSTAVPRTFISAKLARQVTRRLGPEACGAGGVLGERCGPTAGRVDVVVNGCRAATIDPIVARGLPRGIDMVVGGDVLAQSVQAIDFSTRPPAIECRWGGRRRYVASPPAPAPRDLPAAEAPPDVVIGRDWFEAARARMEFTPDGQVRLACARAEASSTAKRRR